MTETALTGLAAVSVGQLRPSPNNPRERLTGIEELAVSIRETGHRVRRMLGIRHPRR